MALKDEAQKILSLADVRVGGSRPWDIQVHDDRFYARVLRQGTLGFGESYVDGWWDCQSLDTLVCKLLSARLDTKVRPSARQVFLVIASLLFNRQSKARAFEVGERHYDIGNDLYERMLDKRLTYTCGYWKDARTLDEAQEAKLDLICRKLNLQPGQRVLDIGCGWGSFAMYAAQKYGVSVVGVTVSKEQAALARTLAGDLPVEIQLKDYRDIEGEFDHIVSVGMFEHVGSKNYRTYMKVAQAHLKDGGLFLLHSIGGNKMNKPTDPWIEKYIFPNGMVPSAVQVTKAAKGLFIIEDWHNFGAYYDKTLMAWQHNVESHWDELKDSYSERFHRMWNFYLLSCAGSFRSRDNQLWQIVLSKEGVPGGYTSVR